MTKKGLKITAAVSGSGLLGRHSHGFSFHIELILNKLETPNFHKNGIMTNTVVQNFVSPGLIRPDPSPSGTIAISAHSSGVRVSFPETICQTNG